MMGRERKIIRLREYDYRQNGAYAVTLCVYNRRCAFSRIRDGIVHLHPFGAIAQECWLDVPRHFPTVVLDEFVIMPNHVYAILFIEGEMPPTTAQKIELRQFGKPQSGLLGTVIGSFKSGVSRAIGEKRGMTTRVWQRGFYDHVIRHDRDLQFQREYIAHNPARWDDDEFNASSL